MAALTATQTSALIPVGDLVMVSFKTSAIGTGAADEWIATGLASIKAIVGSVVHGTAGDLTVTNFEINARGTGVAEGTNLGDLGIEVSEAATNVVEVTVLGVPA